MKDSVCCKSQEEKTYMRILLTTLNAKYVHSNLALKYLSRIAEKAKTDVEMREFTINNDMSYIFTEILRNNYDILCFSCYIWNIEKIKELCENLKKAKPKLKIVLGGPEVSYGAKDFLKKNLWADMILRGEGEYPFGKFCEELKKPVRDFSHISGLTYRYADKVLENPDAPILPMDEIPFPYKEEPERDKVIYYESSRGCPYRCSYCMSSIDKTIRPLSLDRTLNELGYFVERKVKQVKFIDRTFNFSADRAYAIWKYLIDNDNGVTNFHFEICGDLIDEKQIELLKTARKGLFQFEIGIQSTNPEVLKAVNRRPKVDKLLSNIKKLKEPGNIHLHVDLIAGLPFEDYESFRNSFNEVYSLGAENLQLGFLKVLKGTEIGRKVSEENIIYREKAPYEIISNRYISSMQLVKLKMIENVLELYDNKGGFENTLSYLMPVVSETPFDFYEQFSAFFYENGFQHRSHKKEDLYRIMLKFANTKENDYEGIALKTKELLSEDLENTMNFDAVKKFHKKGWEVNGN